MWGGQVFSLSGWGSCGPKSVDWCQVHMLWQNWVFTPGLLVPHLGLALLTASFWLSCWLPHFQRLHGYCLFFNESVCLVWMKSSIVAPHPFRMKLSARIFYPFFPFKINMLFSKWPGAWRPLSLTFLLPCHFGIWVKKTSHILHHWMDEWYSDSCIVSFTLVFSFRNSPVWFVDFY